MIDPRELRIGNIVHVIGIYKNSFEKAGLVQVDGDLISLAENGSVNLIAIPLTPQILEQCGFKRVGNDDEYIVWRVEKFGEHEELCTSGNNLYFYGNSGPIGMPLKTLHQLHNLFFALTGSELEFKSELIGV